VMHDMHQALTCGSKVLSTRCTISLSSLLNLSNGASISLSFSSKCEGSCGSSRMSP